MQCGSLDVICRPGGVTERLSEDRDYVDRGTLGRDATAALWKTVGGQSAGYCNGPSKQCRWPE